MRLSSAIALALAASLVACARQYDNPVLEDQDIRITFLHTSDIHSRLLPYDMTVLASDEELGLKQENAPFGGIARIAHIIERERRRAERVLYVDSGDCFQGAPIFNVFKGEIEQLVMSQLRPDGVVIGNHEFDEGLMNYVKQLQFGSTYPILAANYAYVPGNPLAELARPYHIVNKGGVRIAIIGIANFSSMSSLTDVGNSLGIVPLANFTQDTRGGVLQEYIDFLRPNVDLIVGVSHAGLTEDVEIIQHTRGFDIIFGGHLHVALDPPKVIQDAEGRDVLVVHSGAFAKYVGKLDVVVRKSSDGWNGFDVANHRYTLYPVDKTVPEDATMATIMQPYALQLQQTIDLTSVYAYASKLINRFGFDGTDSPLGNLVAEAMRFQARTDFAMTNTLGIRTDINQGPLTLDTMYNVFPFQNTLTTMYLSGVDVKALLDYCTLRSAGRGCATQVQLAGLEFTMNCSDKPKPGQPHYDDCKNAATTGSTPDPSWCCDCPRAESIGIVNCSRADAALSDATSECLKDVTCIDKLEICATQRCARRDDKGTATTADDTFEACSQNCEPCSATGGCDSKLLCDGGRCVCVGGKCVTDRVSCKGGRCCTREPLQPNMIYEMATNDYIAQGGSGFTVLKSNNTQFNTGLPLRDAVLESIVRSPACVEECKLDDGRTVLNDCVTYQGCVAQVTALSDRACADYNVTDLTYAISPMCSFDGAACIKADDCIDVQTVCRNGCDACTTQSECITKTCDGGPCRCVKGQCVPDKYTCAGGRCAARCASDTECPGATAEGVVLHLCQQDGCLPRPRVACLDDGECNPALLYCYGTTKGCAEDKDCDSNERCTDRHCYAKPGACVADGTCNGSTTCGPCSASSDCNAGLSCFRNLCVPTLARCAEHRCSPVCQDDTQCPSGELCQKGLCRPGSCLLARDAATRCHLRNESLASERCLTLSCPRAEADGRIKRILPPNLEDLPKDIDPDEPQE